MQSLAVQRTLPIDIESEASELAVLELLECVHLVEGAVEGDVARLGVLQTQPEELHSREVAQQRGNGPERLLIGEISEGLRAETGVHFAERVLVLDQNLT